MEWTGSPTKRMATPFAIFDENTRNAPRQSDPKRTVTTMPLPLTTSRFANRGPTVQVNMGQSEQPPAVTELFAMVKAQHELLNRQQRAIEHAEQRGTSSTDTNPFEDTPPSEHSSEDQADVSEVSKLKHELELAHERVEQMRLQLTQSHLAQHTMEQAIGSPFPTAQHLAASIPGHNMISLTNSFPPGPELGRTSTALDRSNLNGPQQPAGLNGFPRNQSGYGSRTRYAPPVTPMPFSQPAYMPLSNTAAAQQQPIGTRLSPTAAEFGVGRGQWTGQQIAPQTTTYMSTTEPLNYRRLLERNMTCNWKYIVDKIVCNNDQQASIFLQQKLKVGTPDAKFEIVQAIIDQAYPLMVNRFGNFLVQRCFEHGTPDQVIQIAQAIRGNTLNLSMDPFGCHVVQKAFDCVPEEYKAIMVHELLRRIPETVIHRYACHVWQKLFELRWSDSPPQIMKYVNEALRGMWHEVALGETGSLVVQNIFENCLEDDKRPSINEVLASIDVVAHGQFGNWCIQHICEHGSAPDRTRAIDHVIRFAGEYSMDQFASKVVEKCLKIGGNDFLDRYLDRICEARQDRPRMPLIDIAGDQFGNYLIQYILSSAESQRREIVAAQIRKHMVSLRGSKYGSRVAMLCCNPAVTTRPGPPSGLPLGRGTGPFGQGAFSQDVSRSFGNDRNFAGRGSFGGYR